MRPRPDPLRACLLAADGMAGAPRLPDRLPARVWRLAARRRRRQVRGAAGLAAACALLATALLPAGRHVRSASLAWSAGGPGGAGLHADLQALRLQRRLHEMVAARLLAVERTGSRANLLAAVHAPLPDPMVAVRRQLDRAAETLVLQAARLEEQYGRTEAAARTFRSVVQRFPDSPWATVAREQLRRLSQPKARS